MTMQIIFKEQIKRYRDTRNLTQKELGSLLGVDYQTVSNWETGKNNVKLVQAEDIANKLQVTTEWLLFGILFAEAELPIEIGYQVSFVPQHIITTRSNDSEFNEVTVEQTGETSFPGSIGDSVSRTLPMIFSTQMRHIRSSRGSTLEQFGNEVESLNFSKAALYESGRSYPTLDGLAKLAEDLHVTQEYLLFGITSSIAEIPASVKIDVNDEPNRDVFVSATKNGIKTVEYSEFTKSHGSTLSIDAE